MAVGRSQKSRHIRLGINVDHVATLRQARGTPYPDPVRAAELALEAGADSITVHLREDRRHIQDRDVERLAGGDVHLNLEMALTGEMLGIAERLLPRDCCLVPERRAELTTEGGLDVVARRDDVAAACERLAAAGIQVSLFVDPDPEQVRAAHACGAPAVELHTGAYADAADPDTKAAELERIRDAARTGAELGLRVHAGHGLHYDNVAAIAAIPEIEELNIGHAIVARAVFDGITAAVERMRRLMDGAAGTASG